VSAVDGALLKQALLGSLNWLASNQEEVNRLNVFPVPDGDTGTNMLLTLQSAVEDIKESQATEVGKIARIAAHGSLMGARGNSGVILSQIFRGFARSVEGKAQLTPQELAGALEEAANAAYRAVLKPTEGTILTVAREAARAATTAAAAGESVGVADVIGAAAEGARRAVEKTPSQLQILRDAGVVDAGGYGLQVMLEGMLHSIEAIGAEPGAKAPERRPVVAAQTALDLPEEGWGYCTEFLIVGEGLDVDAIRQRIAAMGNSVLVVGEPELVKVHVHTDDPTSVLGVAGSYGRLEKLSVGDMSSQHRRILDEASEPAPAAQARRANGVGLVAVASGAGLVEILKSLGCDAVVQGGQTMNPSTRDMLQAIEGQPYDEVVLLPNNKNVVMAAREAVKASKRKHVRLVETHTVPQGIAAVIAFNGERAAEENVRSMREAAGHVQTIEVTHAVRDSRSNGLHVRKGDVIALVNDKLETKGEQYGQVVADAIKHIGPGSYELVTVYTGEGASPGDAEQVSAAIRDQFPKLEVEVQPGGQDHYPFILSVE
jgi:fatty acid kinase